MFYRLHEVAPAKIHKAHRVVAANVAIVAAKCFHPVHLRAPCRVAILLQMQTRHEQLVATLDFFRGRRLRRWCGDISFVRRLR